MLAKMHIQPTKNGLHRERTAFVREVLGTKELRAKIMGRATKVMKTITVTAPNGDKIEVETEVTELDPVDVYGEDKDAVIRGVAFGVKVFEKGK
jgi:hypothetical protein